ncbi:MAG: hypothetical protein LAQ69_17990, partial [Acidobacteriia bacterium]|nr:hypothetical protein [Terriglobia bacterium]
SQEQNDEILIRHPQIGRHLIEVVHLRGVEADGDLTLEPFDVRVLAGLGKSYSLLMQVSLHLQVGFSSYLMGFPPCIIKLE